MNVPARRLRATVACAVVAAAVLVFAAPTMAAQYQRGAAYANWNMPGQFFTNWEQSIVVTDTANSTFWNIQWTKVYGPTGYLGIQTSSTGAATFHFSMFRESSTSSYPSYQAASGTTCTTFAEGVGGRQCRTPVGTSILNKTIRLKLIKSNRTDSNDRWWSAWASIDGAADKYLGQIQAPHVGWMQTAVNFHEYFGEGAGYNSTTGKCVPPGPPKSAAVFAVPTVSSPDMTARTLTRGSLSTNTCPGTDGKSIAYFDGAFTQLGDL
jgi:hypothetical protein